MEWTEIVAITLSLLLVGLLIVGLRRQVIKKSDIANLSGLIDAACDFIKNLDLNADSSIVTKLAEYARSAVRAVEQLAKNGEIEKDNEVRINAAYDMVEQLAIADGLGKSVVDDNEEVVGLLIEAEVNSVKVSTDSSEKKTGTARLPCKIRIFCKAGHSVTSYATVSPCFSRNLVAC